MDITSFVLGYQKGKASGGGSGGGGTGGETTEGVYWKQEPFFPDIISSAVGGSFEFGGKLHAVFKTSDTAAYGVWRLDDDQWVYVCAVPDTGLATMQSWVALNEELHLIGGETVGHYKYDGTNWTTLADLPAKYHTWSSAFAFRGELYCFMGTISATKYQLHKWDDATDTWSVVLDVGSNYPDKGVVVLNDTVYYVTAATNLYSFDGETITLIHEINKNINEVRYLGTDGETLFGIPGYYPLSISKFAGDGWEELGIMSFYQWGNAIMVNGKVHIFSGASTAQYRLHYSVAVS